MSELPVYPIGSPKEPLPTWQGPELAFAQLKQFLYQIENAIEPSRPEIIDRAVKDARTVVDLLEQSWEAQPPGSPVARYKGHHARG
jgi:hypothetical protein